MTKLLLSFLGLALAGCTSASTKMLSENTALISARDLSTGLPSAVRKKALVTAARTAKSQGYDYFAVIALEDLRKTNVQSVVGGPIGEQGAGTYAAPFLKLSTNLTVRFLRQDELPANRDGIYDVSAVLADRI